MTARQYSMSQLTCWSQNAWVFKTEEKQNLKNLVHWDLALLTEMGFQSPVNKALVKYMHADL